MKLWFGMDQFNNILSYKSRAPRKRLFLLAVETGHQDGIPFLLVLVLKTDLAKYRFNSLLL